MSDELRPQLLFAFFCQEALQEVDGNVSLIRMVVDIDVDPPPLGGTTRVPLQMAIGFASEIEGKHQLDVTRVAPSGHRRVSAHRPVDFSGGSIVSYVVSTWHLSLREEGMHWIEVRLDGHFYSRFPLRVRFRSAAPVAEDHHQWRTPADSRGN